MYFTFLVMTQYLLQKLYLVTVLFAQNDWHVIYYRNVINNYVLLQIRMFVAWFFLLLDYYFIITCTNSKSQLHLLKHVLLMCCRLLMHCVASEMGVLEGHCERRVFTHNIDLLKSEQYKLAGRFVSWSVSNGGPGIACLSVHTYNGLLGLSITEPKNAVEDLTDGILHDVVQEVSITVLFLYFPSITCLCKVADLQHYQILLHSLLFLLLAEPGGIGPRPTVCRV